MGEVFVCFLILTQQSTKGKLTRSKGSLSLLQALQERFSLSKSFLPIVPILHGHIAMFTRCLVGLSGADAQRTSFKPSGPFPPSMKMYIEIPVTTGAPADYASTGHSTTKTNILPESHDET